MSKASGRVSLSILTLDEQCWYIEQERTRTAVFLQTLPPFVLLSQKHGGPSLILTVFKASLFLLGPRLITKYPWQCMYVQVTEKTFQEMYINVGMANCEKRPKQERDDIRFTHIAIPTSFYIFKIIL